MTKPSVWKFEPTPVLRCKKTNPDVSWQHCGRKRKHKGKCACFDFGGNIVETFIGE